MYGEQTEALVRRLVNEVIHEPSLEAEQSKKRHTCGTRRREETPVSGDNLGRAINKRWWVFHGVEPVIERMSPLAAQPPIRLRQRVANHRRAHCMYVFRQN